MSKYILRLDVKKFFPGSWKKMTPQEQAAWREKFRRAEERRAGNVRVTHE